MSNTQKIGWIGVGRMGYADGGAPASRAGHDVTIWNRTPRQGRAISRQGRQDSSTKPVDPRGLRRPCLPSSPRARMFEEVVFGKRRACSQAPRSRKMLVDCSSISVEESAAIREKLTAKGVSFPGRTCVGQCQGDQGRQTVVGGFPARKPMPRSRCR